MDRIWQIPQWLLLVKRCLLVLVPSPVWWISQEWLGAILGHPWKATHCLRPAPLTHTRDTYIIIYIYAHIYIYWHLDKHIQSNWNNIHQLYLYYYMYYNDYLYSLICLDNLNNCFLTCQVGSITMNLEIYKSIKSWKNTSWTGYRHINIIYIYEYLFLCKYKIMHIIIICSLSTALFYLIF